MKISNVQGYYVIGVFNVKMEYNVGIFWCLVYIFGVVYIFMVGKCYKKQVFDVVCVWVWILYFYYDVFEDLLENILYDCWFVGVEFDEKVEFLYYFMYLKCVIYLLGFEDQGLLDFILEKCYMLVKFFGNLLMNVGVIGSIVCYDWVSKLEYVLLFYYNS